ncbi:MAG: hypothetical protein JSU86_20670 [Phycisphaerales bacterium]|nr:MAG: hypothetical protein JSU86_20670 [Phycisphaerales bacterium]
MAKPRFDIEPISLANGWSGHVLTQCHGVTPQVAAPAVLPTIEQWRPQLSLLAADPKSLPDCTALKYSTSGEVLRARLEARDSAIDVICRQSRVHGIWRRLASSFAPSRERRNFARALQVAEIGINTAIPLALIERRRPRRQAWLVTAYVPDLVDLDQVALRFLPQLGLRRGHRVKDAISEAVIEVLDRMERNNLSHRDLKASNILLKNWDGVGGSVTVWLVDLDGLCRYRYLGAGRRWRPVMRLAASLLSYTTVTRSDYCRFLKRYLAGRTGSTRGTWQQLYRKLAQQAGDYARRAMRRKGHKLNGFVGNA